MTAKHKEIHEGVGGSGNTVYIVVTVRDCDGAWLWIETFKNRPEAISWLHWS